MWLYLYIFAGDIECAHNAGTKGILINRSDEDKNFGQDYTIKDLNDLMKLVLRDWTLDEK